MSDRGLAHSRQMLLLNESRRLGVMHDLLLRRYAFERFLVRLGESRHRYAFVLKGAMALVAVTRAFDRPTRDMDMLGLNPMSIDETLAILSEVAALAPQEDDAVVFDPKGFTAEIINASTEEPGTRITGRAYLGNVRIPLRIEVSHGHVVTPRPQPMDYPTVLSGVRPAQILCYTPETMLAEKFEAICSLGTHTSRFKDFYDIRELSRRIVFDGAMAAEAMRRTFERRESALPLETPAAFTPQFHEAGERGWRSFLRKQGIKDDQSFVDLVAEINPFVMAIAWAAQGGEGPGEWRPGEGWTDATAPIPAHG